MADKDININIKANSSDASKNLGELKKSLEFTNEAAKDLTSSFEKVYGEGIQPLSTRIGEAEDRLYELAAAGKANSVEFEELAVHVAEMKKTVVEVDNSIDDLAANRGLSTFGTQLGGIGDSLMSLDFDRAAGQAQTLAKAASQISFGKAITSIKNLGSTIINLGKAILANPIFLIAAVIAAVVAAVIKLMDEIGLLKVIMNAIGKVFEWLMKPIKAIIQGLKDLTDWFGWTANAAEDSAEKQAAAADKTAKKQAEHSKGRIQQLDNQIRLAELEGISVVSLEKAKLAELTKTAAAQKKADRLAYESAKLKGELTDEEIADLKSKAYESKLAYEQTLADTKYYNAQLKAEAKKLKDDDTLLKKEEKKESEDKAKEAREAQKTAYADYLAKQKEFAENRQNASRQIEDLRISLIEDDFERELELNRVKYERITEDVLADETLLQEEKKNIIDYYNGLNVADETQIRQEKVDADNKVLADQYAREDAQYALLQELRNTDKENDIAAIVSDYEAKYELALGNIELEKELKIQQEEEIAAIEAEYRQRDLDAEKAASDEKKRLAQEEFDAKIGVAEGYANSVNSLAQGIFAISNNLGSQDEKAKEARAKRQFKIQKALNLSLAVIDGIKAVQASLAQSPIAIGPIPNPAGIASLAFAAITSAVNIAKIASSQYQGGGSGGGAPSVPSMSGGGGAVPSAPNFEPSQFFGLGEGKANDKSSKNGPTKVYVTETDITKTQNKVAVIESRAKIG